MTGSDPLLTGPGHRKGALAGFFLLFPLLYLGTAKVGFLLAPAGTVISAFWPPAALGLAALAIGGWRLWPGVLLGAFLANALSGIPFATAAWIALGNTAEALAGAALFLRAAEGRRDLGRYQDVLVFALFGGLCAPLLSATNGCLALVAGGGLTWAHFPSAWWAWWSGDAVGALVLGPFLLVWAHRPWSAWNRGTWWTFGLGQLLTALIAVVLFMLPRKGELHMAPAAYLILPLVVHAGFSFGPAGASAATLLASTLATLGTVSGRGTYSGFHDLNERMLHLQSLMVVMALCSMTLAALVEELKRERDSRYRSLVEQSHEGIFFLDLDTQQVRESNPAFQHMLGYPAEALEGLPLATFAPYDPQALKRDWDQVAAGRQHSIGERTYRRRDGSTFDVEVRASRLERSEGRIACALVLDISRRKQAEEERDRLVDRLTELKVAIDESMLVAETDAQGVITAVNDHFCRLSGFTREELVGQNHRLLNSAHHPEAFFTELWDTIRAGRVWHGEVKDRAKDGRTFWLGTTIIPHLDADGRPDRYLALRVDITGRKLAEEALKESQEHMVERLEAQVAECTQALHDMNAQLLVLKEKAEEASRAKSAFLAGMSHELRTPMNAILGFAQLMARDPDRNAKDAAHLQRIMRAGDHLLDLINDVLSVSRIEAHKLTLNPQPFDMAGFFQGLQDMIGVRAKAKGLSLHLEVDPALPPWVVGDEGKLRQVLLNLLGNAVKFTQEGGLGLAVQGLDGNLVKFEVSDTGPGIAPSELTRLFGSFEQTETGRRSSEGSGLGLYLSQSIVQFMGGEIRVESEPGRGSRFSFVVALPPAEVRPAAPASRRKLRLAPDQPALKQLVVDDSADNRELLTQLLESAGFTTLAAADGQEALEAWKSWKPQVVWMDMRMPVMDGFEATRRIRALEAELGSPPTAILAITASVLEQDKAAVLEAGCDAVLGKPFREQDLFDLLARHTGLRFQEACDAPSGELEAPGPEDLRRLDPAWRAAFRSCLTAGDLRQALALAEALPPGLAGIAAHIRSNLQEFRLDALEQTYSGLEAP